MAGSGQAVQPAPTDYTPTHLAEKILTSRAAMEGERKQVTVLFADLKGSMELLADRDPEEARKILDPVLERMMEAVHRYEGTVNQVMGDGIMALFGAPIAHEDHAARACYAALRMQQAMGRYADELRHTQAVDVQIRVGINSGDVVVRSVGSDLRTDYTAVGQTTHLAARMEQTATPGEILLTESTYKAIRHEFHCEALGERRVKGKADVVAVYRLGYVRGARDWGESRISAWTTSPLIGRERETALLRACLQRLGAGEGGIVGVIGEPGVGKSRLVWEARRSEPGGPLWLEGRAFSFGQKLTYGPFMDALRAIAGIDELEGREENWRRVEAFLVQYMGADAAGVLPFAGMLLGLEVPAMAAGLVARLDPQDVRGQIFIAARGIFQAIARAQPVVLELEDWHWADETSAALLDHLLPLTESAPLLVCFAGRADAGTPCTRLREIAGQRYPQRYVEILLGPLSSSDSNRLVDSLLGVKELPPQLRGLILRKGEGNPLFVEEVVRSLQASGALRRDPATNTLRIVGDANAVTLPDTIEGIIMARIDRLEGDVKEVLRLASVIGRSFYRRILQALDEAEHQLDECLDQLKQLELIRQRRLVPEIEYMFKHALVQEASYHSILADRRRQLHIRVGDVIEALFSDRLDEFASFLAYHYARAAQWEKAQLYLLRAGDQAARMAADAEAIAHYTAAMDAIGRASGVRWDPLQRASLERKIGEALFRLGQHEEASDHLYTALALLGDSYPRARVTLRLKMLLQLLHQAWHQLRPGRYRRLGALPSEAEIELIRAYISLGWVDYFRDEERFFFDVIAGLNWAERRGILTAMAHGSTGIAVACQMLRLTRLAAYYHRRALQMAKQSQDLAAVTLAEFGIAFHDHLTGNWDGAVAGLEAVTRTWQSLGKLREQGISGVHLAWVLLSRGELARAATLVGQLRRVADDAGDRQSSLLASQLDAIVQMYAGQLPQAAAALDRGIEGLKAIPDHQILCEAYGLRARCALWMGDLKVAAESIEEGTRLIREHWVSPQNTESVRSSRGWLMLRLLEQARGGTAPEAVRHLKKAIASLHRLGRVHAGAVPIALCLEGSGHWLTGATGRAAVSWRQSMAAAEKLGSRYYLATTLCEIGRRMRDASQLEQAARQFQEIGLTFDQARTLRYLGEMLADGNPGAAVQQFERAMMLHETMSAEHERAQALSGYRNAVQRIQPLCVTAE